MLTFVRTLLGIFWALWFGGIMIVFVFAVALFRELDKSSAVLATGVMFPAFERYSLVLAALSLAVTVAWRALDKKSRAPGWTFGFLALATLLAVLSAAVITPKILRLRTANQTHTPEFARTHGQSGITYVAESVSLLAAGILLLSPRRHSAEPLTPA